MVEPAGTLARSTLPRVLVVDDELLGIFSIKRTLRDCAELTVASTHAEAHRLLEHGYASTPAILLTGGLRAEWVNPAHALRAELMTKPFPTEQLRDFVRRVVRH